jgi:phosphoribosylaminoimidazole carboxylase (NCAIR synthetase)
MQEAALAAGSDFGYPFMLKRKLLAYDGRGNAQVQSTFRKCPHGLACAADAELASQCP